MTENVSEKKEQKIEKVRPPLGDLLTYPFEWLFSSVGTAKCGHRSRTIGTIKVHGGFTIISSNESDPDKMPCCITCAEKISIRCAWCGKYICVSDPVTLYKPMEGVTMPEWAVEFRDGQYVGCLRLGCADTGMDRAGFWRYHQGTGHVYRDAILDHVMGEMRRGNMVIVENVAQPDTKVIVIPDTESDEEKNERI